MVKSKLQPTADATRALNNETQKLKITFNSLQNIFTHFSKTGVKAGLAKSMNGLIKTSGKLVTKGFSKMGNALVSAAMNSEVVGNAQERFGEILTELMDDVLTPLEPIINLVLDGFENLMEFLGPPMKGIFEGLSRVVLGFINFGRKMIGRAPIDIEGNEIEVDSDDQGWRQVTVPAPGMGDIGFTPGLTEPPPGGGAPAPIVTYNEGDSTIYVTPDETYTNRIATQRIRRIIGEGFSGVRIDTPGGTTV